MLEKVEIISANGPMDGPTDGPTNRRTSWIVEDLSILKKWACHTTSKGGKEGDENNVWSLGKDDSIKN